MRPNFTGAVRWSTTNVGFTRRHPPYAVPLGRHLTPDDPWGRPCWCDSLIGKYPLIGVRTRFRILGIVVQAMLSSTATTAPAVDDGQRQPGGLAPARMILDSCWDPAPWIQLLPVWRSGAHPELIEM